MYIYADRCPHCGQRRIEESRAWGDLALYLGIMGIAFAIGLWFILSHPTLFFN